MRRVWKNNRSLVKLLDLRCRTSLELRAQRRCIPVRSGASCFQNPHRSCHLPVWSLCAGLWSRQRCKLWVPPAAGTGGLCSFGLSPSAATVSTRSSQLITHRDKFQNASTPTRSVYLDFSLSLLIAELNTLIARRKDYRKDQWLIPSVFFFFKAKIGKWKDCADLQHIKKSGFIQGL